MTDTEKPTTPQGFKTFIGNLAYATTEDGLKQTFSTYGKVLNSVIIKRRGRSLGYGFVDFETKEQAEKAVASLNGSELDSRKINVELAKPREQQAQPTQRQPKPRAPRTQNKTRRPARQSESREETKKEASEEPKQNEDGFVEKVGRRRQKQQKQAAAKQQQQQQQPKPSNYKPPRERKPIQPTTAAPASTSAAPQARKRTNRKKRTPRPAGDVPTEAGLFVANIPYNLDEESFKKIFEEKGFSVVKHRVVKLPNGKSLGYGFVDLKDGEEQKKAVEALNNTQVGGREISVKVAMVKPETEAAPTKSE